MSMNKKIGMDVPDFSVGCTAETCNYVVSSVSELCNRSNTTEEMRERMIKLFLNALSANPELTKRNENINPTEISKQGRALRNGLCDLLVKEEGSELYGKDNFIAAQERVENGGNVIFIQNHTSILDMLVTEALLRRAFDEQVTDDWAYISGGPMNNPSSLQGVISSGFHRISMTSERLQSKNGDAGVSKSQNAKVIKTLMKHGKAGGNLVVLYPEGQRSEGDMLRAKPKASAIPFAVSVLRKEDDTMVLPTNVIDANKILRMDRSDPREHSTSLQRCVPGPASLIIGEPEEWSKIVEFSKNPQVIQKYIQLGLAPEGVDCDNPKTVTSDIVPAIASDVMCGLIANLSLTEDSKGYYATHEQRSLIENYFSH